MQPQGEFKQMQRSSRPGTKAEAFPMDMSQSRIDNLRTD